MLSKSEYETAHYLVMSAVELGKNRHGRKRKNREKLNNCREKNYKFHMEKYYKTN